MTRTYRTMLPSFLPLWVKVLKDPCCSLISFSKSLLLILQ